MKNIEIKHRFTNVVLFTAEVEDTDEFPIRSAVVKAVLRGADLRGADLRGAYLRGAKNVPAIVELTAEEQEQMRVKHMLAFRERHPDVPVIENLDAKILAAVSAEGCRLDMSNWHSCETTHCRAGWATHIAGKAGYDLERKSSPEFAGLQIYRASTGRVPDFYADNDAALADIKACAEGNKS